MTALVGIVLAVMYWSAAFQDANGRNVHEYALTKKLFNEGEHSHPHSELKPINVSVGFSIRNLKYMDVKKGEIALNVWMRFQWKDPRLTWNPTEFGNISYLTMKVDKIWSPDMMLTLATGKIVEFVRDIPGSLEFRAIITHEGLVKIFQPTSISTTCEVNIAFYPFDEHTCFIEIGPWSMNTAAVNVISMGLILTDYSTHNEWNLSPLEIRKKEFYDQCCPGPYGYISFPLLLSRRPLFRTINYVFPAINIAVLSLLVFLIPPEVGKSMEAGINLLLSLSVYLLLVNSKMPSTSLTFPLLTKFYACAIFILVISMCCSSCVYALYFMNPSGWDLYHMPPVLQVMIFDWLGPLVRYPYRPPNRYPYKPLKRSKITPTVINVATSSQTNITDVNSISKKQYTEQVNDLKPDDSGLCAHAQEAVEKEDRDEKRSSKARSSESTGIQKGDKEVTDVEKETDLGTGNSGPSLAVLSNPRDLDVSLEFIAEHSRREAQRRENHEYWQAASMIVSRVCVVLLVISIVASFLACFMLSPRLR